MGTIAEKLSPPLDRRWTLPFWRWVLRSLRLPLLRWAFAGSRRHSSESNLAGLVPAFSLGGIISVEPEIAKGLLEWVYLVYLGLLCLSFCFLGEVLPSRLTLVQ